MKFLQSDDTAAIGGRTYTLKVLPLCAAAILWVVLSFLLLLPDLTAWVATPLTLLGALCIPGILLAVVFRLYRGKISEFLAYAFGLGLSFLLLGGLLINYLLPFLGIAAPLSLLPLVLSLDAAIVALVLFVYARRSNFTLSFPIFRFNLRRIIFGCIPLVFVVLSVLGAQILNNGGEGTLTLVMLFALGLYGATLIYARGRAEEWIYPWTIYCAALSLLLMYALRSSHVFGWDINQEYQVFQTTLRYHLWKPSYYPGLDYNACISITILPTILQVLGRMPGEYIFKALFQMLFAALPVLVYVFSRRYVSSWVAFIASLILLSQTWFYEQMPALIRQEMAFIAYGLLLLVLFDRAISPRLRYALFTVFTVALILSHYSTAYVWLSLMLLVLVLVYGARVIIPSQRKVRTFITPLMFILSLALLLVWEIPLTHTIGKVSQFVSQAPAAAQQPSTSAVSSTTIASHPNIPAPLLVLLAPLGIAQQAIATAVFASENQNTQQNLLLAVQQAWQAYGKGKGTQVYAADPTYMPQVINTDVHVPSELPGPLAEVLQGLGWISRFSFIDILPLIGLVLWYIGLRRRFASDRYQFFLFSLGACLFIVLVLCVPYIQQNYNFTRLYLQMFLTLCVFSATGAAAAVGKLPRFGTIVLAIGVALLLYSSSGALDQITGGLARITLDQPPSTLDAPYISDGEVAGARWLATQQPSYTQLQADIVANLRLQSVDNTNAYNDLGILPQTLLKDGYVYLTKKNVEGDAYYEYNNNLIVYTYPLQFLDAHKALIYNDGDSRIYR